MSDEVVSPTAWTDGQRALLDALLDEMIPPGEDGRPGAGQLGVADALATHLPTLPGVRVLFDIGLAKAAELLKARGAASSQLLAVEQRAELVRELERVDPAFFTTLQLLGYVAYYSDPKIGPYLGLPNRPPQPLGYQVPTDDDLPELLAPVLARGKQYRDA